MQGADLQCFLIKAPHDISTLSQSHIHLHTNGTTIDSNLGFTILSKDTSTWSWTFCLMHALLYLLNPSSSSPNSKKCCCTQGVHVCCEMPLSPLIFPLNSKTQTLSLSYAQVWYLKIRLQCLPDHLDIVLDSSRRGIQAWRWSFYSASQSTFQISPVVTALGGDWIVTLSVWAHSYKWEVWATALLH